ncbi:MAG: site-specific integrase [Caldilineaceae bacterium]
MRRQHRRHSRGRVREYMVRKGFSENTIKAFRNDLKITAEFLGDSTQLNHISTQHLEDYLTWLQDERGKPCSAKTLARRITTLKVFFGWLHGIGVIGTDPADAGAAAGAHAAAQSAQR